MLKRAFDIVASFCGLVLLSPVIAIVAWKISRKLGSPVLFRQVRPGKDGKPFEMIKFRTMLDAYDEQGVPLPNEQRFTQFGSFLRSTSLDELPELFNVLKGDMSLVGPRPLLVEYLPLYNSQQARRHEVRPGVTGWAQVNGRNAISWEEKFNFDVWYVDNNNLLLDFKILLLTIKKVFFKEGITPENQQITPKFTGSSSHSVLNKYTFREIEKEDLFTRVEWLNDPRIYKTVNIQVPVTLDNTESWFRNIKSHNNRCDFVLECNGEIVAMSGLVNVIDCVSEGYTFVHPDMKGRGIGTISHFLRALYGLNIMKLKAIRTIIDSDNIPSRRVVEKVGYYIDGTKDKDLKHNGKVKERCYYKCDSNSLKKKCFNYEILSNNNIELTVAGFL